MMNCHKIHDPPAQREASSVLEFLAKNKMSVTPHPSYSPYLLLCDFFFFPPTFKMMYKKGGASKSQDALAEF